MRGRSWLEDQEEGSSWGWVLEISQAYLVRPPWRVVCSNVSRLFKGCGARTLHSCRELPGVCGAPVHPALLESEVLQHQPLPLLVSLSVFLCLSLCLSLSLSLSLSISVSISLSLSLSVSLALSLSLRSPLPLSPPQPSCQRQWSSCHCWLCPASPTPFVVIIL